MANVKTVAGRRRVPMMGLPIEPVYLLSSVPGDVASALGGAVGAAAIAGWKRIAFLTDQARADQQAHSAAVIALLEATHEKELAAVRAAKPNKGVA